MEERKEFKIPEHIIDIFKKKYELYPCFIKTRNVVEGGIDVLTKKNKIVWFDKIFDGKNTHIKGALIDYSVSNKIMIYVKAKESEKVYELVILSSDESGVSVDLLLKGLNKYYTIDFI
jgi:hypothetical protein